MAIRPRAIRDQVGVIGLTPASFDQNPATPAVDPAMRHPSRTRARRAHPGTRSPDIGGAIPGVITGNPHKAATRRRDASLDDRSRGTDANDHLSATNRGKPQKNSESGTKQ